MWSTFQIVSENHWWLVVCTLLSYMFVCLFKVSHCTSEISLSLMLLIFPIDVNLYKNKLMLLQLRMKCLVWPLVHLKLCNIWIRAKLWFFTLYYIQLSCTFCVFRAIEDVQVLRRTRLQMSIATYSSKKSWNVSPL